ncbi:2-oxo-4-hydroxy-4-carboxy-5-ureidoimidazoline decarboxylase [Halalkalicoccus jeotgali]|uniref:2-oxo-4-hydroxy-4-carboxy-5-ureidoimidazoline decarboxylase n=2 Tax=Halalkalicoccus jeotgali (strain DSM 18796 / CECT 7217 / JCM 14584 / KCTC 4019 / B3) TaxID=795797 RepID=URAD_HALJB|nr:2-oxo-4-hydroxy-4-carboxy-5-ureidoimidazoline decarboxylase [Halalkalicoccus jeotgali]D8JBB8.1 RecName: Full=2-oxo-4-hydroxy-4-carboxy-5-ureidoimidazoline decarboxylase; Short=OHCU decarboxylase [Halalkalicoccus jeotgali B3]ADJ16571.1 Uricase [Halalkalicoccus jeotgali B3]ELY41333.1 Uricase [Halalkalicoccus jeotgali B3]
MTRLTVEDLNQADKERFVDAVGDVYEESPWVAKRTWSEQPFSSIDGLQQAMANTVQDASQQKQLELLRAHPDLGERTEMTDESQEEQASAGLDRLPPAQYETFQTLNDTYRDKFGFPFIMAVKDESVGTIQQAMEDRIDHSRSKEFQTALNEVNVIAALRLEELTVPRDGTQEQHA